MFAHLKERFYKVDGETKVTVLILLNTWDICMETAQLFWQRLRHTTVLYAR
jgi:hypothetical protein